ncbi:unnamed protein product [Pleuronectes platessa]|uniref:Uncharacterized protein n=1 Tax=Pleuronectes platessa TaxID=8262 RepID=A0A9N7W3B7_PLEPL|nr:unnamed protein product [Pleuronectes platessa]
MDPAEMDFLFEEVLFYDFLVDQLYSAGSPYQAKTLLEISALEDWLRDRPGVSHFLPQLVAVRARLRRNLNPPASSTNPYWGSRLAIGGTCSLQEQWSIR